MTIGERRLRTVERAFRESGVVTGECKVDGPRTGQAAWCYTHGFSGAIQDCRRLRDDPDYFYRNYDCPNQGIAAWIERRHEYNRVAT